MDDSRAKIVGPAIAVGAVSLGLIVIGACGVGQQDVYVPPPPLRANLAAAPSPVADETTSTTTRVPIPPSPTWRIAPYMSPRKPFSLSSTETSPSEQPPEGESTESAPPEAATTESRPPETTTEDHSTTTAPRTTTTRPRPTYTTPPRTTRPTVDPEVEETTETTEPDLPTTQFHDRAAPTTTTSVEPTATETPTTVDAG
ncbi:hypothetical protein [Nocardia neocaledoniensis]|uniref:hypothetical protein n=1 Tax=Nocardia neocaledoniensis TaxID=236511 RepID=UPI0024561920|nr:hypothetical protein [Nocardia neocaledoniensis]